MPYDALGNYVPGDDTPTSDDMSYATSVPTTQSYQQQRMARVPQNLQGMGAPARGLTDLLTGAARGTLAGTIGAPGDISQMLRDMSPEVRAVMERKFGSRSFPTTQETLPYIPSTNLSGTNVGETGATLGSNIVAPLAGPQLLGAAARGTAKAAKAAAPSVAQMAAELMEKQGLGPMYVVKPNKGGNWLKDEVERAVLPIKQYGILPHELATHPSNIIAEAVNSWVDKKLVPYIKNEMGTPEDPVRLGIEKRVADAKARKAQGKKRIAKLQAAVAEGERLGVPSQLTRDRLATEIDNVANQYDTDMASVMHSNDLKYNGRVPPRNQMSTTAQSKRWEGASDLQIGESTAGKLIEEKPFIVTGAFNARYKTQEEAQAYLDRLHKLGEFEPGIAERLRLIPPKIEETGAHIKNPWLKKVAPETPVYGVSAGIGDDLQFKHLTDELKNALNPQSGLPPELLLSPNKMPKTVDDAIAHVGEINAWRARNMANAQIKITEGMPVHKQYPEGYKWLELTKPKLPDVLPEGYTVKPTEKEGWFSVHEPPSKNYPNGRSTGAVGRSPEEAIANHDFNRDALDKALKYEGETMGHCVGSYCKDVESGKSRIYSLRDAKGEPHATIEVKPHNLPNKFSDLWDIAMKHVAEDSPGWDKLNEYGDPYEVLKEHFGSHSDDPKSTLEGILENFPEAKDAAMAEIENAHPVIAQIKGKQNRAPADKYLPFVQDFVKSQPWSEVGDLNNTGLTRYKDKYFTEPELKDFTKSVVDPTKEWYYNSPYHQTYKQDFDRKSDLYNDLNQWSERTNIPVGQQRFSISDIHGVLADPGAYELSVLEDVRDAVDWLKVNQPEIPKHLLPETPPTESMTPLQAPTGNALDPRGDLATAIRLGGGTPPTYATQDEIEALVRRYVPDEGMKDGGVVRMKDGGVVRMQEGGRAIPSGFDLNQYMPSAPANAQPIATEPTPQVTIAQMRAELQRAKEGTQALSAQPSVNPAFSDLRKTYDVPVELQHSNADIERALQTARTIPEFLEMQKLLGVNMPPIRLMSNEEMSKGDMGTYSSGRKPGQLKSININSNIFSPQWNRNPNNAAALLTHELTHAADDEMLGLYETHHESPPTPEMRQFVDAYEKIAYNPKTDTRPYSNMAMQFSEAQQKLKGAPKENWYDANKDYRANKDELTAWAITNSLPAHEMRDVESNRAPLHLDPSIASAQQILTSLAIRAKKSLIQKKKTGGVVHMQEGGNVNIDEMRLALTRGK